MSTPRDRDGDGFDDGRTDGPSGWQEPAHLGGGDDTPAEPARPADPAGPTGSSAPPPPGSWQPPGWDLPAVEPERPGSPTSQPPWQPPSADQRTSDVPPAGERRRGLGGLFGPRPPAGTQPEPGVRPDVPPEAPIVVPPADPWGTQAWALGVGWVLSDGTGAEDAPLTALAQTAPVRPGKEDAAGRVMRGRGNGLDLVAFDIVSPVGRQWVSTHAVTAAPVLGTVPGFRLSPARMWRHGTGGLLRIPSPDPEFDRRWVLLAAEDGPQVRRLVADPVVRQLLLGSDDGDELWSALGFVAAVRPDGNRPQLVEHHARLLAAVISALAAAA
jgi:hypothetical protein